MCLQVLASARPAQLYLSLLHNYSFVYPHKVNNIHTLIRKMLFFFVIFVLWSYNIFLKILGLHFCLRFLHLAICTTCKKGLDKSIISSQIAAILYQMHGLETDRFTKKKAIRCTSLQIRHNTQSQIYKP